MSDGAHRPRQHGSGRAGILAVAKQLFMTRGYRAVSTREIAEAVGVTQPALYHHFGGKEELYVAVLEDELDGIAQVMRHAVRLDASAVDRLAAMATAISARSEHDLSLMFHDLRFEVSSASRQRIGDGFQQALVEPLVAVLRSLADEGTIAQLSELGISDREAATFVLGVIRTLRPHGVAQPSQRHRADNEVGALVTRLVVNGLGKRSR